MSFEELKLSDPILKAVKEKGYETPSPIQAKAIPAVLEGRDLMAAAQTGTGKTAGFVLPILDILSRGQSVRSNHVRALIITPTRELAAQIYENALDYGKHLPLKSAVVFGGVKINPQMMKLRRGVDVLVATPGRLLDLYNQNAVSFKQLEILVLDEADRMLDMGFINDIRKILALLPNKRQNLLFSATFSDEIRTLAKGLVQNPIEISVSPRNAAAKTVRQWIVPVDKKQKSRLLINLIKENNWHQVLVFSRTKHGANKLVKELDAAGVNSAAIHGNKSQGARTKALADFKSGKVQTLVATDIAARGIDIDQLPQVVNFDLPNVPEDYVHRIGRTGRAGAEGQAVSLVCADEHRMLSDIERLIKKLLERKEMEGFEPSHALPPTSLTGPPPRKPKVEPRQQNRGRRNSPGAASGKRHSSGPSDRSNAKPQGRSANRAGGNR